MSNFSLCGTIRTKERVESIIRKTNMIAAHVTINKAVQYFIV